MWYCMRSCYKLFIPRFSEVNALHSFVEPFNSENCCINITYLKLWNVKAKLLSLCISTVKPAHAVSCIRRSHISCPVIDNFIWIEPLLRGLLSYQATFSLSERWPLNTGWIVNMLCLPEIISIMDYFLREIVGLLTWRKEISL
jgi:hypothetical protein